MGMDSGQKISPPSWSCLPLFSENGGGEKYISLSSFEESLLALVTCLRMGGLGLTSVAPSEQVVPGGLVTSWDLTPFRPAQFEL